MALVSIIDSTRGCLIGSEITVAETSISRMVGLLPKSSLGRGQGLWIRPSSGVHTIGMRFIIDVIGLDKQLRVVKLWRNLVPHRITAISWNIRSVIELPAGNIDECGVSVGDQLQISHANAPVA